MNQSLKASPQQNASCRRVRPRRPIKCRSLAAAGNIMMPHGCRQRGIRQSRKGRMARTEDQPRSKHRIAIFFIASMRKQTRNHCRNHLSSKPIFPHHHFNSAQTETELLMA
ncbi:hypothetical protein [Sphingobium sp. IP1]|uniref:hypothetical protein n=1 Tax=Sphingobium sp. IP1 TaxID=2021637 RepID=UPI00117ABB66|nr:hypothetical protein [Sphingobium sp. IP1]